MSEGTDWLKALHDDLWPKNHKPDSPVSIRALRRMTREEWDRVFKLIEDERLVCEMTSVNMFGGYGVRVYAHEPFPGTGPDYLLLVHEDHLPTPTRFEVLQDEAPQPRTKKVPGSGRDDAWELFSKYTHSAENRKFLKKYKLEDPRDRHYYDY